MSNLTKTTDMCFTLFLQINSLDRTDLRGTFFPLPSVLGRTVMMEPVPAVHRLICRRHCNWFWGCHIISSNPKPVA